MAVNGKQKGKRGELEFAAYLRDKGIGARRGVQFKGGADSPDVIHDLPGVHFEVKRTERLALHDALSQAVAEAGDAMPVVAYRRNRGGWVAVLPMDALIAVLTQKR